MSVETKEFPFAQTVLVLERSTEEDVWVLRPGNFDASSSLERLIVDEGVETQR